MPDIRHATADAWLDALQEHRQLGHPMLWDDRPGWSRLGIICIHCRTSYLLDLEYLTSATTVRGVFLRNYLTEGQGIPGHRVRFLEELNRSGSGPLRLGTTVDELTAVVEEIRLKREAASKPPEPEKYRPTAWTRILLDEDDDA